MASTKAGLIRYIPCHGRETGHNIPRETGLYDSAGENETRDG